MRQKYRPTLKDIVIAGAFLIIVGINVYQHLGSGAGGVGALIEQTILIMLSFVGLVEISSNIGWSMLVPDFYQAAQRKKREEETQRYVRAYFEEDVKFLHNYAEARIGYSMAQLGVNKEQMDTIRLNLIKMRCMPLKDLKDAREKVKCLVTESYPVMINQNEIDSSKLSYRAVQYYMNFTDMMFLEDYARELTSILALLIEEEAPLSDVDKLIVPHDSNFLLGAEVGKRLGKPVVKMRLKQGKIETEKRWEGNLKPDDKVLIIHDILVSGDQIADTLNTLPATCQVLGLYCIVVRKEGAEKSRRIREKIPVHRIIELGDEDIRAIRGGK